MMWSHDDERAAAQQRVVCVCVRTCEREQKGVGVDARGK